MLHQKSQKNHLPDFIELSHFENANDNQTVAKGLISQTDLIHFEKEKHF